MIKKILKELKFLAEEILKAPYSIDSSKIIEKINLLEEKLIIHKFLLDNNKFQKENTVDHKKIEQDIFLDSEIIPEFVKKENTEKLNNIKEKKINDLFGKDFNIGLNDRLAFIKNLFDSKNEDYQRVMSQLSTFDKWKEAETFINKFVKPDYNDWEGKNDFEKRFFSIVKNNFI